MLRFVLFISIFSFPSINSLDLSIEGSPQDRHQGRVRDSSRDISLRPALSERDSTRHLFFVFYLSIGFKR